MNQAHVTNGPIPRDPGVLPPLNPFSTRCTQPGRIPFLCGSSFSLAALCRQLRGYHWRAQIVGPHGSGKSTLLAHLLPRLEQLGIRVLHWQASNPRRLADLFRPLSGRRSSPSLLVIDGFESIGAAGQGYWRTITRLAGWGLLVTTHQPLTGMPTLVQLQPQLPTVVRLVQYLLRDAAGNTSVCGPQPNLQLISSDDVAEIFQRHGHNVREMLFEMYDLYDQRTRS